MQNQIKESQVDKIEVVRLIAKSYMHELQLTPHIVTVCQAKKVSLIMSILRQFDLERTNKNALNQQQKQHNQFKLQCHLINIIRKQLREPMRNAKRNKKQIKIVFKESQKDQSGFSLTEKQQLLDKLKKQGYAEQIQLIQLPDKPPITKLQFEQWSKIWPINFIQQQYAKEIPHSPNQLEFLRHIKNHNDQGQSHVMLINAEVSDILLREQGSCSGFPLDHAVMKLLAKWPKSQAYLAHPQKYYYLTGLKLFVRSQLCGMCAMALIHSRLKALYSTFDPSSVMDSIFGCPSLNHKITMFKII